MVVAGGVGFSLLGVGERGVRGEGERDVASAAVTDNLWVADSEGCSWLVLLVGGAWEAAAVVEVEVVVAAFAVVSCCELLEGSWVADAALEGGVILCGSTKKHTQKIRRCTSCRGGAGTGYQCSVGTTVETLPMHLRAYISVSGLITLSQKTPLPSPAPAT